MNGKAEGRKVRQNCDPSAEHPGRWVVGGRVDRFAWSFTSALISRYLSLHFLPVHLDHTPRRYPPACERAIVLEGDVESWAGQRDSSDFGGFGLGEQRADVFAYSITGVVVESPLSAPTTQALTPFKMSSRSLLKSTDWITQRCDRRLRRLPIHIKPQRHQACPVLAGGGSLATFEDDGRVSDVHGRIHAIKWRPVDSELARYGTGLIPGLRGPVGERWSSG